jgi:tRNA (cytidine56-2'-O)-methyltransferase
MTGKSGYFPQKEVKRLWSRMTEPVPSRDECLQLLKEAGCTEDVIAHCIAVEELAQRIAQLAHADIELVTAGALLHDIGRSRTHGVAHAVEGGNLARKFGLHNKVVHIIERHMGAGIAREEAEKIGLPPGNYTPITLEEKIVAHSDNLVQDNKKAPVMAVVTRFRDLGYNEAAEKILALHGELSAICGKDLDAL